MTRMTDIFFGLIAEKMSVVVFQPVCKVQAQFQPAEETVHGLHICKLVIIIHQFQQQFVFWLSQSLRQLVVAICTGRRPLRHSPSGRHARSERPPNQMADLGLITTV